MAYDADLAERVRDRMVAVAGVSEKKMFGGIAFLTWGNMTVGVYGDGLIARIEPGTVDNVLAAEPDARPFDMGGRQMPGLGPGAQPEPGRRRAGPVDRPVPRLRRDPAAHAGLAAQVGLAVQGAAHGTELDLGLRELGGRIRARYDAAAGE
jgi:TfoX N-terminal domain